MNRKMPKVEESKAVKFINFLKIKYVAIAIAILTFIGFKKLVRASPHLAKYIALVYIVGAGSLILMCVVVYMLGIGYD